jgi:hypothetical protein
VTNRESDQFSTRHTHLPDPRSAQHIPGNLQERCIQTVGILAGESTGTTLDLRLELFLQAVGSLIRDFSLSTHMYIDNLAHIPLGDWQQAHPDIESPFTREEMMEYCAELQSRDDFEYVNLSVSERIRSVANDSQISRRRLCITDRHHALEASRP